MAERLVTLIRHGKYHRDTTGNGGGDLVDEGYEQARFAADVIGLHYPITRIIASTLQRAITTAHIIAVNNEMDYTQDATLSEGVFHIPEKDEAYFAQFPNLTPETVMAYRVRVAHAFDTFIQPPENGKDEHIILVSHGNVIRYFVVRSIGAPIDLWTNLDMYHCGITRLSVNENGSVRLITHNEVAHLPRRLWSS